MEGSGPGSGSGYKTLIWAYLHYSRWRRNTASTWLRGPRNGWPRPSRTSATYSTSSRRLSEKSSFQLRCSYRELKVTNFVGWELSEIENLESEMLVMFLRFKIQCMFSFIPLYVSSYSKPEGKPGHPETVFSSSKLEDVLICTIFWCNRISPWFEIRIRNWTR